MEKMASPSDSQLHALKEETQAVFYKYVESRCQKDKQLTSEERARLQEGANALTLQHPTLEQVSQSTFVKGVIAHTFVRIYKLYATNPQRPRRGQIMYINL